MRRLLCLTSFLLVVTIGCASPAQDPAPTVDLGAERASLMEADQAWADAYAASENPADAFVSFMVDDAYLLPPDAPLAQGTEAIHTIIGTLEAMPDFAIAWTPSVAEVGNAGDLGFTIGSYQMTVAGPDGTPVAIVGKYMTAWEKQADGSWLVTADMFNADGPPSPIGQ